MGAAKQYKTLEDIVDNFENHVEKGPEREYWTVEYRYHDQVIDNKFNFDSYGEAKRESLKFLKERIENLKARKPLKKDTKEFTNFVKFLTNLPERQVIELRDKLQERGIIELEKHEL